MKEENQAIIKALNMYGRVPEMYELLEEIERLNNIIKEVSEKLNTQLAFTSSYQLNYQSAMRLIEEAKSILDKENKE